MSDNWYKQGARAVDDTMKDEILTRLGVLWKAHPDLRLTQLIGNAFDGDPYYVEDYDMIKILEEKYLADQREQETGNPGNETG